MAAAFDTLSAAKALQAAGFDQAQAEAVASAIRSGQGELATKDDVAGLQREMAALRSGQDAQQAELAALRSGQDAQQAELGGLRADYAGLRAEVGAIKWVLGLVAALNIAILVRLLLV